ncbi:hypothetical protein CTAYLR_000088 [Chrysophaeum taylorii]|uniref:Zn-dependent hydrolase n=1 Tax=Chrysophaeum taylorii TaxID=2483200 RepID=A0AAD7XM74_9STRA|nr:hypothetical protein CTAYLR_000088 [Chrysophaeum taylorii]
MARRGVIEDLQALRRFGAVNFVESSFGGDGRAKGVCRPALSKADLDARLWFAERCADAGLTPRIDRFGTVLAGKGGLLCGSHSDSQAQGGWLDGALGCAYALEVAREVPGVSAVNFQDEEGRFGTLTGSRTFCGEDLDFDAMSLSPEWAAPKQTLGEALEAARPTLETSNYFFDGFLRIEEHHRGFFEAHIEQGRRLERAGLECAGVSSIVGLRQLRITAFGEQNHAGTTLTVDRRDAGRALLRLCAEADEAFGHLAGWAQDLVWTFGIVDLKPGAASIIPSLAEAVLQIRDPDDDVLGAAEDTVRELAKRAAVDVRVSHDRPPLLPTPMDEAMLGHLREAGVETEMRSGAIHDAASLARAGVPAAMLFVPSIGGVSHAHHEDTRDADILKGAQVYVEAARRMTSSSPR